MATFNLRCTSSDVIWCGTQCADTFRIPRRFWLILWTVSWHKSSFSHFFVDHFLETFFFFYQICVACWNFPTSPLIFFYTLPTAVKLISSSGNLWIRKGTVATNILQSDMNFPRIRRYDSNLIFMRCSSDENATTMASLVARDVVHWWRQ